MGETHGETNGFSHDIVVIWLDSHIGDPDYHSHLKAAFSSNIDPTNLEPIELISQHGSESLFRRRIGIPCELHAFADPDSCLQYIRESLDADKRIFLITSDYLGTTLLPHIAQQYPEVFQGSRARISCYIFTFYMIESLDWLYDYIDCALVFDHEADLLRRLVHDIAVYYIEIGKILLGRDALIDIHQALIYFEWANALSRHESRITAYQDIKFIQDLEYLIQQAEKKIKYNMNSVQNEPYSQGDMQRSLNNSILIYCSEELENEATQILSMLQTLTNEQGTLFHNCNAYIAKLHSESRAIKHCCPIIIFAKNSDQMKILNEISSLASINRIYLVNSDEHASITENDQIILETFPKVRNIYSEAKILALEWAAERASICAKIAEFCSENGDSDSARMYYIKAIKINKHLSNAIKNN